MREIDVCLVNLSCCSEELDLETWTAFVCNRFNEPYSNQSRRRDGGANALLRRR